MHPLLINEAPLQVLPNLAKAIGLNEALILQQIHYWLNPAHNQNVDNGRRWVYNTYEQWQTQFPFWCTRTIRSSMDTLERLGLITTFIKQNDFRKVKHYTINYDALDRLQGISGAGSAVSPTAQKEEAEEEKKEEEEESVPEMLFVWNDTVQSHLAPCQTALLTPRRALGFKTLRYAFAKQGISWRTYCDKIAKTRFLMGDNTSGFKVTLDWALNFDNACKVLEGAIYDKPSPTLDKSASNTDDWTTLAQEIKTFLPMSTYAEDWLKVCQHLVKTIGIPAFRSWFLRYVSLVSIDGNTATIQVDTAFRESWLDTHYRDPLKTALRSVYPTLTDIKFQVVPCIQ